MPGWTCVVWDLDGTLLHPGSREPVPGIADVLAAWAGEDRGRAVIAPGAPPCTPHGQPGAAGPIMQAVATSAPTAAARAVVAELGWSAWFGHVAGTAPGVDTKAEVVTEALLGLGLLLPDAAAGTAVVGDTPADVDAARSLGLAAVGVAWGRASEAELRAAGASWVARVPADLRPDRG